MAIPVYVPLAFIVIVVGGLGLFSKIYRKRQAERTYVPWFPTHPERDTYITLLQQTDPKPSDALLKAALLRRAVADIRRIFRVRDDKAALTALLAKGSIDDELWANFQAAEKELEAEIVDVVTEANAFVENWGQIIFASASEIVQNEKHRDIFTQIAKNKQALELKLGTSKPQITAPIEAPTTPSVPSITLSATKVPANDENAAPAATLPTNGKLATPIATPIASPVKESTLLPPLTPSKQSENISPPASIGRSAGKKKSNKKR